MLTRKHFTAMAAKMRAEFPPKPGPARTAWKFTLDILVEICRATNPAFNEARFRAACLPPINVKRAYYPLCDSCGKSTRSKTAKHCKGCAKSLAAFVGKFGTSVTPTPAGGAALGKFILVAPSGARIVATAETIPGVLPLFDSGLFDEAPKRDKAGRYDIQSATDTEMLWNEQETREEDGQRVFVDEEGIYWIESLITTKEI